MWYLDYIGLLVLHQDNKCVTWICVQVFQLFFFLKYNVKSLPGQY